MKPEELIQKLDEHKTRTGKTLRELSDEIGVTQETISKWLNDHQVPDSRPIIESIESYLSKQK